MLRWCWRGAALSGAALGFQHDPPAFVAVLLCELHGLFPHSAIAAGAVRDGIQNSYVNPAGDQPARRIDTRPLHCILHVLCYDNPGQSAP